MPVVIAIDFGLLRTGLAISDTQQIIATPLKTVMSKDLMTELTGLIKKHAIKEVVIGYPLNLNSKDTDMTQNVRYLKEIIEKTFSSICVHLQDERFTSKIASQTISKLGTNKQKKNKKLIDQVSATIILQDFLNRKNSIL